MGGEPVRPALSRRLFSLSVGPDVPGTLSACREKSIKSLPRKRPGGNREPGQLIAIVHGALVEGLAVGFWHGYSAGEEDRAMPEP